MPFSFAYCDTKTLSGIDATVKQQPYDGVSCVALGFLGTRIVGHPIDLPGFPSVFGECSFRLSRVNPGRPEGEAHQHRSTVNRFVVVKISAPIFELPTAGMPSVPTVGVAKSKFHSWVAGLNQRS